MNHSRAKKIVISAIGGFVALDALALLAFGLLLARSEFGWAELVNENRNQAAKEDFAFQVTLLRTEDGLDLWSTPQGETWTVHGDQILAFLPAEQKRDIYEPPGHEVKHGDVVLDCGANIGMFTRTALARGAGLVVAIEPSPLMLEALRRNLDAAIRAGRVVVYPKGVWDRDYAGANSLVIDAQGASSKVRVPLTTIDRIVSELKLPRVSFIKMDIEGAEKPALLGATATIKQFRPRMSFSFEHLPDDFAAIPAVVNSIDRRYTHRGGQRLAYDRIYQQQENQPLEVFERKEFVEGVKREANRRLGILCLLYTRRRANPEDAGLSILEFESKMSFPREHLMFAVWYLQEQKLVRQEGNSDYVITGPGVDYVETRLTSNRILSRLIQAAALSDGHSPS